MIRGHSDHHTHPSGNEAPVSPHSTAKHRVNTGDDVSTGSGGSAVASSGRRAAPAFQREYRVTSSTATPPTRPGNVPVATVSLGLSKGYKTPTIASSRR